LANYVVLLSRAHDIISRAHDLNISWTRLSMSCARDK